MQKLKKFEFTGGVAGEATYDWAKLMDGGIYQLAEGDDYKCKTSTFATLARNQAKKKGLSLQTNKVEGGIVIQAIPLKEPKEGAAAAKPKGKKGKKGQQTEEPANEDNGDQNNE